MSYVPHLKGLGSWISKIYISFRSNDPTGSYHIFAFEWPKWPNSSSDSKNGHVIHQIEANEPRITIKIVLAENFDRESKNTEKKYQKVLKIEKKVTKKRPIFYYKWTRNNKIRFTDTVLDFLPLWARNGKKMKNRNYRKIWGQKYYNI